MWKVLAVFLLLLVLMAISVNNKESIMWFMTIFLSLLGMGIFFYAVWAVGQSRRNNKRIADIKSNIGEVAFDKKPSGVEQPKADSKLTEIPKEGKPMPFDAAPADIPTIQLAEIPIHPLDENAINVPKVELPKLDIADPIKPSEPKEESDQKMPLIEVEGTKAAADTVEKSDIDEKDLVKLDFAKLRTKLKRGTTGYDDDDDKNPK